MIDPLHSLAFSIQANPGVYAVLIGSGVSRSARIPTGWEVTLDLIRKLARLRNETCDPAPECWYRTTFGMEPDYSDILNQLAKTPSERQQLLRSYWEPNIDEREEGEKEPTEAHRAIAHLATRGFIRIILTTNFDRLMETALIGTGITPTVLSSSDHVHGALPLIHMQCCVFKLHGDYLDTRIRNTTVELERYPREFDQLLDRIFDEFGLVVCGWSAEWDGALRSALNRAPSRRFTTYWAVRSQPTEAAQGLIRHRGAQTIQIEDADGFFRTIQEYVDSIEEFSKPHPLSDEVALASLKRYMAESKYRIQLSDLIDKIVFQVMENTSDEHFIVHDGPRQDRESITTRVRRYEAACTTLLTMAPIAGFWAEEEHHTVWQRALQRLASRPMTSGTVVWLEMQRYPATLLLYALGLGAVEGNRLGFLRSLLSTKLHGEYQEDESAAQVLPPYSLFSRGRDSTKLLEGMERHYAPLNDWMHDALRPYADRIVSNDSQYTRTFDKLEILIALGAGHIRTFTGRYWAPPGAFGYRHQTREVIFREIEESLATLQLRSPFVTSGIFGDTVKDCEQNLSALKELIPRLQWY